MEIKYSLHAPQQYGRRKNKAEVSEVKELQVAPAVNVEVTKMYEVGNYPLLIQ